jgi:hypothetical protein
VLHHILEYARIFRSCYDALRSGGVAVFVEPGAVFHEALTLALAEAIVTLAARGEIPRELRIVAAWVEQTRLRLSHRPARWPTEIERVKGNHCSHSHQSHQSADRFDSDNRQNIDRMMMTDSV